MKGSMRPLLVAACLTALVAGCGGGGGGGGGPTAPPVPPTTPNTLSQLQAQVFTPSCARVGCHDTASAQAGLVLAAGASRANLVNVPSSQQPAVSRVAPGDAESSYLVRKVRGDASITGARMAKDYLGRQDFLFGPRGAEYDKLVTTFNNAKR